MELSFIGVGIISAIFFIILLVVGLGFVYIGEQSVGLIIKRYGPSLPDGKLIALKGEAGYQADTLAPGWYFFYFPWKYKIIKSSLVVVPQGQIALITTTDGATIPNSQLLGKEVDCDDFQNARKFLENGGQKGRQLGILKTGAYRINKALFEIIDSTNCGKYGLRPDSLVILNIPSDSIGVVKTQDGLPLPKGKIAGSSELETHNSFQDPQAFIAKGGFKGLQEEVLLSGVYTFNPWFIFVQVKKMVEIPIAHVGVVVSSSGDDDVDVSGAQFTHGNLVKKGGRGIWDEPLLPGKHPLNPEIMSVELVPTANVVLNWANESSSHQLDANLSSIKVRAKDGFSFSLDVSQIIHVAANDAAKVISRVGSMKNLVENVLEPIIGNYFRNAAQASEILDFINTRSEKQKKAAEHIRTALLEYNVIAVDTLIGDLVPPEELMKTLTDRKIASEQQETYKTKQMTEIQKQSYLKESALAEEQKKIVIAQQSVNIADSEASQQIKRMHGESEALQLKAKAEAEAIKVKAKAKAEAIQAIGEAKAKSYKAAVEALGANNFSTMEVFRGLAEQKIKITPDVLISGNGDSGNPTNGIAAILLNNLIKERTK